MGGDVVETDCGANNVLKARSRLRQIRLVIIGSDASFEIVASIHRITRQDLHGAKARSSGLIPYGIAAWPSRDVDR